MRLFDDPIGFTVPARPSRDTAGTTEPDPAVVAGGGLPSRVAANLRAFHDDIRAIADEGRRS